MKLKILIFQCNPSSNMNPLTPNTPYLAHPFTELRDFWGIRSTRSMVEKCSWSFRIRGTMWENWTLFVFLNVCSLAYLPYYNRIKTHQSFNLGISTIFLTLIHNATPYGGARLKWSKCDDLGMGFLIFARLRFPNVQKTHTFL